MGSSIFTSNVLFIKSRSQIPPIICIVLIILNSRCFYMTSQMMPKIRVTVLYFAQIHETTRKKQEIIELSTNTSIKDFISIILTRYPNIKNIKNVKISVNYHIVNSNANPILKNNDEVALLPPISGG